MRLAQRGPLRERVENSKPTRMYELTLTTTLLSMGLAPADAQDITQESFLA